MKKQHIKPIGVAAAAAGGSACAVKAALDLVLYMFGGGPVAGRRRGKGYSAVYVSCGNNPVKKWLFTAAAGVLLAASAVYALIPSDGKETDGE